MRAIVDVANKCCEHSLMVVRHSRFAHREAAKGILRLRTPRPRASARQGVSPLLTLDRIVLREIHLPLREPFRISSGEVAERRILLLELHDGDGGVTWSECVAGERPNYSAETIDTAWLAIREWISPRVLGTSIEGPVQVHDLLEADFCGHRMAKAAVEMGYWALAAQREGTSLSRLLGGTRDRVATGKIGRAHV